MISVISRRVQSTIDALQRGNQEEALINLIPALDKTAKKAFPTIKQVGSRIKKLIHENEPLIHKISGNPLSGHIVFDGISFPEVIYKRLRCNIAHEGELGPKLKLDPSRIISLGKDGILQLPHSYIDSLLFIVITEGVNSKEKLDHDILFHVLNCEYKINELWGNVKVKADLLL